MQPQSKYNFKWSLLLRDSRIVTNVGKHREYFDALEYACDASKITDDAMIHIEEVQWKMWIKVYLQ